jgi:hypothetical protein
MGQTIFMSAKAIKGVKGQTKFQNEGGLQPPNGIQVVQAIFSSARAAKLQSVA